MTVKRNYRFFLSGETEAAMLPVHRDLEFKRSTKHSCSEGKTGSLQAVIEAGGRERAAVVGWLDSLSNEYHLGLQAFWCGGSILLPCSPPWVGTGTVLSSKDPLLKMCPFGGTSVASAHRLWGIHHSLCLWA